MDLSPLKRPIPIGVDDYEEVISQEYLCIDKMLLIKDF